MFATLALSLAAAAATPAGGPVTVEYVDPQGFTDIREGFRRPRVDGNPHLNALRKHFEKRVPRYLAAGQTLHIRVTDVDLAGDHRAQTNPWLLDVRLVTNVYPPGISLNYTLKDPAGAVLRTGDARLRDLGFDIGSGGPVADPYRYEKRMLDKWLYREFGGKR